MRAIRPLREARECASALAWLVLKSRVMAMNRSYANAGRGRDIERGRRVRTTPMLRTRS